MLAQLIRVYTVPGFKETCLFLTFRMKVKYIRRARVREASGKVSSGEYVILTHDGMDCFNLFFHKLAQKVFLEMFHIYIDTLLMHVSEYFVFCCLIPTWYGVSHLEHVLVQHTVPWRFNHFQLAYVFLGLCTKLLIYTYMNYLLFCFL